MAICIYVYAVECRPTATIRYGMNKIYSAHIQINDVEQAASSMDPAVPAQGQAHAPRVRRARG